MAYIVYNEVTVKHIALHKNPIPIDENLVIQKSKNNRQNYRKIKYKKISMLTLERRLFKLCRDFSGLKNQKYEQKKKENSGN